MKTCKMKSIDWKSANEAGKEALWNNFYTEAVDDKKKIPVKKIKGKLSDTKWLYGKWRKMSPKARRFGLNKGMGKRYRRKIKELNSLIKQAKCL